PRHPDARARGRHRRPGARHRARRASPEGGRRRARPRGARHDRPALTPLPSPDTPRPPRSRGPAPAVELVRFSRARTVPGPNSARRHELGDPSAFPPTPTAPATRIEPFRPRPPALGWTALDLIDTVLWPSDARAAPGDIAETRLNETDRYATDGVST